MPCLGQVLRAAANMRHQRRIAPSCLLKIAPSAADRPPTVAGSLFFLTAPAPAALGAHGRHMVALLLAHVELRTPAKRQDVLDFYARALGGKISDDALAADGASLAVVNCGVTQLRLRCLPEEAEARSDEASSLLAEAMGGASNQKAEAPGPLKQPLAGHLELWTQEPLESVVQSHHDHTLALRSRSASRMNAITYSPATCPR